MLDVDRVPQHLIDAAYNNKAACPEWQGWLNEWNEASIEYRERFASTMNLPYGTRPRAKIDVFPGIDATAPCMVYIHGGYWQLNSKDIFSVFGSGVASYGWSVAMIGYTLAPEASLTEIVDEIDHALDWLAANGSSYNVGPQRIVVGSSAGGLLAALAASHPSVSAAVTLSGIFELAPLRDTFLNKKLQLTDAEIANLSPLRRPPVKKPFTLAVGTHELPLVATNSIAFCQARRRGGAPSSLIEVPGADHFSILDELRCSHSALTDAIVDLARPAPQVM
ncbi:alpha/beta hydrolase [Bradyrhizobium tropiciagri]|uniref:alpha/beta hydrolase n=1 Tax=Bradyrhizobium tropiciagri TaxID=312253 RepID=UPI001BA68F2F|nr:alpha/beta hydrolase [Bradyrhizobium tropiciagri]MBR0898879.1 alpha/beta hydrolase [Bradyrhizobium tropiciagri]